jgi:hypothetical protein
MARHARRRTHGKWSPHVVQRMFDVIFRRERHEPDIPVCPDHKVDMRLRGKQGRPSRFSDQTEEEYTLIYFCPIEGCNNTAEIVRAKSQIPVPGEAPERPSFARRNF